MIHSGVSDSLSIVRFELGQLHHLLRVIGRGVRAEMSDLQIEIELAREKRGTSNPLEDQRDGDDLIAVADLGRYGNYTGIVMAFAIYERFLMDVLNVADREIDNKVNDQEREFRRWGCYVKGFRARPSIDFGGEPFSSLEPFREIRNKIAHQGAQTLGERRGDDYTPGSEIPLSEQDTERCMNLVETCCSKIYEDYLSKAMPHLEQAARQRIEAGDSLWAAFSGDGAVESN
jgi:hypothetical protein